MIKINKKWYIDADNHGYILVKRVKAVNKKTNEEYLADRQVGFHATVSSALNQFVRLHHRKLVQEQELSLSEAINEFKKMESFVLETCNKNTI